MISGLLVGQGEARPGPPSQRGQPWPPARPRRVHPFEHHVRTADRPPPRGKPVPAPERILAYGGAGAWRPRADSAAVRAGLATESDRGRPELGRLPGPASPAGRRPARPVPTNLGTVPYLSPKLCRAPGCRSNAGRAEDQRVHDALNSHRHHCPTHGRLAAPPPPCTFWCLGRARGWLFARSGARQRRPRRR